MKKKTNNTNRFLSVIVPAYKQEKTIKRDLMNIINTLNEGLTNMDFEVICVVDGNVDKTFFQEIGRAHV